MTRIKPPPPDWELPTPPGIGGPGGATPGGWVCDGWWGWMWEWGSVEDGRKSSSMSKTLASKDLEDRSFRSNSFILFCIMIVFRVIFSPGRPIRSIHGIHCRKTDRTCEKCAYSISVAEGVRTLNAPTRFLNLHLKCCKCCPYFNPFFSASIDVDTLL